MATRTTAPICHFFTTVESQQATRAETAATAGQAPSKPGQERGQKQVHKVVRTPHYILRLQRMQSSSRGKATRDKPPQISTTARARPEDGDRDTLFHIVQISR